MKWIAEDNTGLCLYVTVSDEQLDIIRNNNRYYLDEEFTKECDKAQGHNCHIFSLTNDGDLRRVLNHLRNLLKEYRSVSWWDRNKRKFRIIHRRYLCHQE